MKVSTQKFVPGAPKIQIVNGKRVYSRAVELISLDQFIIRARKACGRLFTPRQLLTRLLQLPIDCRHSDGCDHPHHLLFRLPNGTEILFWLEK